MAFAVNPSTVDASQCVLTVTYSKVGSSVTVTATWSGGHAISRFAADPLLTALTH